jgi:hypothetical protein
MVKQRFLDENEDVPNLFSSSSACDVNTEDMAMVSGTKPSHLAAVKTAEQIDCFLNCIDRCNRLWKSEEKSDVAVCAAVILVSPLVGVESLVKIARRAIGGPLRRLLRIKDGENACKDDDKDESEQGSQADEEIDMDLQDELNNMDDGADLAVDAVDADGDDGEMVVEDDNGEDSNKPKSKMNPFSKLFKSVKGMHKRR